MANCTTVTNAAIITIKLGIRTFSGIIPLTNETTMFDITKTNAVASPIPSPLIAEDVTPKVGHIPSNNTKTGFSFRNPFEKFFH